MKNSLLKCRYLFFAWVIAACSLVVPQRNTPVTTLPNQSNTQIVEQSTAITKTIPIEPTRTPMPELAASPTLTPTPRPSNTPTPTPTIVLPVGLLTPLPMQRVPLVSLTLPMIAQIARWGDGGVADMAYSLDGSLLAVGTEIGLYLYQAQSLELVYFIPTPRPVEKVAFSRDGSQIAFVAGGIRTIRASDGQLLWHQPLSLSAAGLGYSPEMPVVSVLVRDSEELYLYSWQVTDGTPMDRVWIHELYGTGLALSPQVNVAADWALGKYSNQIRVWNLPEGQQVRKWDLGMSERIERLVIAPDGRSLVTVSYGVAGSTWVDPRFLQVRDIKTGALKLSMRLNIPPVNQPPWALAFNQPSESYDGSFSSQLALSFTQLTRIIDINNGKTIADFTNNLQTSSLALVFSPDGSQLATGAVEVWDTQAKARLAYHNHGQISLFSLAHDSQAVAYPYRSGLIVRSLQDGSIEPGLAPISSTVALSNTLTALAPSSAAGFTSTLQASLENLKGMVISLDISPDNTRLAAGTDQGTIYLWDTFGWRLVKVIPSEDSPVISLSFSNDSTWLATSTLSGHLRLFGASDGTLKRSWRSSNNGIAGVAFSPDGSLMESNIKDLNFWQVPQMRLLRSLHGIDASSGNYAFSPNGGLVALNTDGVNILDTHTGMGNKCRLNQNSLPFSEDFTLDAKYLLTSWSDGMIYAIDPASCQTIFEFDHAIPGVLHITADHTLVVMASAGTIEIWGLPRP